MNTAPFPKPAAWLPLPGSTPIGLLDLTAHLCAWPVGDATGAQQMFCGLATTRKHFCAEHAARAFTKPVGEN